MPSPGAPDRPTPRPHHSGDTLILGAGPAGLCAAHVLSKAGASATVLEASSTVGGLARTLRRYTEHGEFRFDIGGHRWFTRNPDLDQLFRETMGVDARWVSRSSRILLGGRFYRYPLELADVAKKIGPRKAARILAESSLVRARSQHPSHRSGSMEDAYVARYGRTIYETFFAPYSEKVWGMPCDRLSGEWVSQRTAGIDRTAPVESDRFLYPAGGFGTFAERLAAGITAAGNDIRLQHAIQRIVHDGQRVTTVEVRTPEDIRRLPCDQVISSIPLTNLARMLDPAPPAEVIAAADSLRFRDLITVNLMIRKPQVTPDSWLYFHDRAVPFGRMHEPKNWSAAMVPGDDFTSLVVEYFCSQGDDVWRMTDEELITTTLTHLDRLGFVRPRDVIGGFTLRATRAYPVYDLAYRNPLDRLKLWMNRLENLQYIGRSGAFRYNNTDHAIESGLLAAQNVLGASFDLDAVNADPGYHESGVIGSRDKQA